VIRPTRLAVRYVDDRIVLSDRSAWAYFQVPTVTYDFLADEQRQALAIGVAGALAGLRDAEAHLVAVPRVDDVDRWATALDDTVARPAPGWAAHLRLQRDHLAGAGFTSKQVYLGVALGRRRTPTGPLAALRRAEHVAGLLDDAVPLAEVQAWHRKAEALGRLLAAGALRARHATAEDVCWLVRRAFHRGLADPGPLASSTRPWGAGELVLLGEGVLRHSHRHVRLEQPGGGSCVATLAAARFPDALPFPGAEWLQLVDDLDGGVEVSLRLRLVPSRAAAHDVRRKLAEVHDQERHIADTGAEIPLALAEQAETAKVLDYQLNKERVPLVYGWPRLVVAAADEDGLGDRVALLVDRYRDLGIDVAWPSGDQLDLFCEALPGDRVRVRAYEQRQSALTVAGGMAQATTDLGDATGPYIGAATGRGRGAVHFDPLAAAGRNRPTVVSVTGEPGAGKTFAAQLLTYQMALRGTWTLLIDPKGEAGRMAELPGVGSTRVLRLSAAEAGLLDPFGLADDAEEGAMLAMETLRLLLPPGLGFEREGALLTVCKAVAGTAAPSLHAVVTAVAGSGDAAVAALAPTLRAVEDYPLATLCFARGAVELLAPEEHLTILQVAGLSMPEPGVPRQEQGWHERLSVAVMFLIADLAKRLAQGRGRHQPKAIVLDEAWMLTGTPQGRNLVPALARMGRSRNTAVVLVSQNAHDLLDERVLNCVSAKLAFRSSNPAEVDGVLELLGVAVTDEHRAVVRGLANGECVFADLDGRVGTIAIDPISDELRRAFDTTPRAVMPDRDPTCAPS
jgi:hypothetical protein